MKIRKNMVTLVLPKHCNSGFSTFERAARLYKPRPCFQPMDKLVPSRIVIITFPLLTGLASPNTRIYVFCWVWWYLHISSSNLPPILMGPALASKVWTAPTPNPRPPLHKSYGKSSGRGVSMTSGFSWSEFHVAIVKESAGSKVSPPHICFVCIHLDLSASAKYQVVRGYLNQKCYDQESWIPWVIVILTCFEHSLSLSLSSAFILFMGR